MKKFILITTIFFSVIIFLTVLVGSVFYPPNDEISANLDKALIENQKNDGELNKFLIPSLKISTNIKPVGITKKGNIASPRSFADVGWYKYGPIPGQVGTAIIDGHVDNGLAFPGVFSNLKNIKIGDSVYVTTKDNASLHFVVESIKIYDYDATTENIFTESDTPRLLLITCTGNWIPKLKTHNKRLVVTTVLSEK